MANEKLTMVTLSGPRDMVDSALQNCVVNRDFHLEDAVTAMSAIKRLYPFETQNPYSEMLQSTYKIMSEIGVRPEYRDFSNRGYTAENTLEYIERIELCMTELDDERVEYLKRISENEIVSKQLEHIHGINENLHDLTRMKYVKFRFGRMPEENYEECRKRVDERGDVFFITTEDAGEWIYGMYFSLPSMTDRVDAIFSSMGFERIRLSQDVVFDGTVEETSDRLEAEANTASAKLKELDLFIKAIKTDDADELLARYSFIRFLCDSFYLRTYAGYRHDRFYIIGWIPSRDARAYASECESIPGFSCILANPKEVSHTPPPVRVKTGFLRRIYAPFLEMYGLPSYTEIDPTLFMAITYTVIFGIMFGDVGQGAVLFSVGLLMWKLGRMWLGRIVACVGVSAFAFGFVYGSVFGFEDWLPGFKVMEDGNALKILLVSVCVGAVLLISCMLMNIINGFKQHDMRKSLFSSNGIAGLALYGGIAIGAAVLALTGRNIFTPVYICLVIIAPLFCIMSAEPLTRLLNGEKNWMPKSIGSFLVEGFFELFETALTYVSNTVSFLRIGAFAISHAGMMSVVFMLSSGGSNIIGLVIGNAIVMGIEAVLVCIQVMRLEFYELFGHFYESGGVRFSPRIIAYDKMKNH